MALHDYFVMLRAIVGKCLSPLAIPVVLSACFEELLSALLDDGQWGQLTLGYGGLLQLTRDVSFFTHAVHTFETEQSHRLAQQLLQRARRDYTRLTKAKEDEVEQAQDRQEGELATRMEGAYGAAADAERGGGGGEEESRSAGGEGGEGEEREEQRGQGGGAEGGGRWRWRGDEAQGGCWRGAGYQAERRQQGGRGWRLIALY